jgi:hypothetical protein
MNWNMELAKRDFALGHLEGFHLDRAIGDSGWHVQLTDGLNSGPLVDAREKKPRLFKTADAAIAALEKIGFEVVVLRR